MKQVFKGSYRVPRERPSGSPGFVNVAAGKAPEDYVLDPAEVEGLLVDADEVEVTELSPRPKPKDYEALMDAIKTAIGELDPDAPEQWTADDKPRVKDIEDLLGFDITETERDEAWELYQKEGDK